MRAINSIEECDKSRSTLSKVLSQGGAQQRVAVVRQYVASCSKVQEDLQDRVCLHTATLHVCIVIALLHVTRCIVHCGTCSCNSSQLNIAFYAVQILWMVLRLWALLWLSTECLIPSDGTLCATHLRVQVTALSTNL